MKNLDYLRQDLYKKDFHKILSSQEPEIQTASTLVSSTYGSIKKMHNNLKALHKENSQICSITQQLFTKKKLYCYINKSQDYNFENLEGVYHNLPDRSSRVSEQLSYLNKVVGHDHGLSQEHLGHYLDQEYLQTCFEDLNHRNGLSMLVGYPSQQYLTLIFYSNQNFELNILQMSLEDSSHTVKIISKLDLGSKLNAYSLECQIIEGGIEVIIRTQSGLICYKLDSEFKSVLNMTTLKSEPFTNCVDFYSDFEESLAPLVAVWKDPNTSNCRISVYDENHLLKTTTDTTKRINSISRIDKVGITFSVCDFTGCQILDTRMKDLIPFVDFSRSSRRIDIVHESFKQGRTLNLLTNSKVCSFDLRNPGEHVLEFEHFCRQSPCVAVPSKSLLDANLKGIWDSDIGDFETLLNSAVDEGIGGLFQGDSQEDPMRSSFGLFSPAQCGEILFLNNFQPLRKDVDVKNHFSYEVIKAINNSLACATLFDGLTRFRKWPTKLYASNYEHSDHRIRGLQLLKKADSVITLALDNRDGVSLQVLKSEGDGRVYHVPITFDREKEALNKLRSSNFLLADRVEDEEVEEELAQEGEGSEGDFSLEDVRQEDNFKEFIDLRQQATQIVEDTFMQEEMTPAQIEEYKQMYAQFEKEVAKTDSLSGGSFEYGAISKQDLEGLKVISNKHFYVSQGIVDNLKGHWT